MNTGTQAPQQRRGPKPKHSWSKIFLVASVVFVVMLVGVGCGFLTATINTKDDLSAIQPAASSQIYDINGKLIKNVHAVENRVPVPLSKIPINLQNAFIANEDTRFYEHCGIDPIGILRALWADITHRSISEGGSTITQQLAKNAYLTQDRTFKRKIQEVFLALQLEHRYTKKEILQMYLNQIYFGQGAYGVQAAAQTYFGKDVSELDLSECAMLAGIPRSPNYYSPLNNLEAAKKRKTVVLEQMLKHNYITQDQFIQANNEPLHLRSRKAHVDNSTSYFVNYVIQLMIDKYGADKVYREGLKIYTTLDLNKQHDAEQAIKALPNLKRNSAGLEQPQVALVAINPHNGYIEAMIGGRGNDQFNRAIMAVRQPGSAFKPFVFATTFENNMTPSTTVEDSPLKIGDWQPQNDDRTFRGLVSIRQIATYSINVPTIKLANSLGIQNVLSTAQSLGISTLVMQGDSNDLNLASALGGLTRGVTPIDMAAAYAAFDNNGVYIKPIAIIRVLDRNGQVIDEAQPQKVQAISPRSANLVTNILQDVIKYGTGRRANIGRPAAGKTGTTDDFENAWFIGYTPNLVTAVWVGGDDNMPMPGIYGGTVPAKIWHNFMIKALANTPVANFSGVAVNNSGNTVTNVTSVYDKDNATNQDKDKSAKADKTDVKNGDKKSTKPEDSNSPNSSSSNTHKHSQHEQPAVPNSPPAVQPKPGEQNDKGM